MAIALIELLATILWTYTALTAFAWVNHTRRLPQGDHVAALTDLISHLVPAMIVLVVTVLLGALIGLPSVVAFIALLFPLGTSYGTHMALTEATEAPHTGPDTRIRILLTLAIAAAIIAYRQWL